MKYDNLAKLLFLNEASFQVWMKKFQISQEMAQEYMKDFEQNKASIYQKDITRYNSFKNIADVITTVIRGKEVFKLKSDVLLWLTKLMFENPNIKGKIIEEDYYPILVRYQKNKNILPPINSFENINDLIKTIKSTKQNQFADVTPEQEDKFYSLNGWDVFMPHTTQASCKLGQGTTWCTARTDKKTEGQNYYLNYVIDKNYVLFYVIKQGNTDNNNPWQKLSVGYNKIQKQFEWGTDGHVTVNADNEGLEYEMFSELVGGDWNADLILSEMEKKAESFDRHPATEELSLIGQNLDKFIDRFGDFDGVDADEVAKLINNSTVPIAIEVAEHIMENVHNAYANNESIIIKEIVFSNKQFKNSLRGIDITGCRF